MKSLDFGRWALCICAPAALLAGCGGSQPPIGAPGAMPLSSQIATHAKRGGSWMLPEAKSEDLLYVSDDERQDVAVYSYPGGKLVGVLSHHIYAPAGECVDRQGDVFVIDNGPSQILEYAHGGIRPIARLSNSAYHMGNCSVDPTTGNLAVANGYCISSCYTYDGNIAVYTAAQGKPTYYNDRRISNPYYCTYDSRGNLFFSGKMDSSYPLLLAELVRGRNTFKNIEVGQIGPEAPVFWYRGLLDIGNRSTTIAQFKIKGRRGINVGSISIDDASQVYQFSIFRNTIIASSGRAVSFWKYPSGGMPTKTISEKLESPSGVVVSP
jgi:hypothetical protein